jgi:ubiquinone biosynthesis protein
MKFFVYQTLFPIHFIHTLTWDADFDSGFQTRYIPDHHTGSDGLMESKKDHPFIKRLQNQAFLIFKETGQYSWHSFAVTRAFFPFLGLLANREPVTVEQLGVVFDKLFETLYQHPLTRHSKTLTRFLRNKNILPNDQSTENLIRYVVDQILLRSPVKVPEMVVNEFWMFFEELFSEPELKGMAELNLDIARIILRCYEPFIADLINLLKETRRLNASKMKDLSGRMHIIREDLTIIRRQIRALRYIKPFFQSDPKDFETQAQIIAAMVREFGPFFIKMAQVAAANADFLPAEIARELRVFQEDVPPMTALEVTSAFEECLGRKPHECYFEFDIDNPIKSGSIGSVYLAKKPVSRNGREELIPVIVKISRNGLDREFMLGRTVLGVAIISSHYWAPHSKLAPFLEALQQQAEEFVKGFQREIDFEQEAANQQRFADRSRDSLIWNVPEVFSASRRIIEMEYIENATSISHILDYIPSKKRSANARRIASRFLYTVCLHAFVHQECHGDLHPGNILFNANGDMYFVDWGNCLDLKDKWKPMWDYVLGAVTADVALLATALINLSADPAQSRKREPEIKETLARTLKKKDVAPLKGNFIFQLKREGIAGLRRRVQVVLHLMSNTQHLGLVVKSEYLHLSRSLTAITGTYIQLYKGLPRLLMVIDAVRTLGQFPVSLLLDRIADRQSARYLRLLHRLPLLTGFKNPAPLYITGDRLRLPEHIN